MTANRKELVGDFLRKAKQLEYLIDSLPSPPEENEDKDQDLVELEKEMQGANKEYLDALEEAGGSLNRRACLVSRKLIEL